MARREQLRLKLPIVGDSDWPVLNLGLHKLHGADETRGLALLTGESLQAHLSDLLIRGLLLICREHVEGSGHKIDGARSHGNERSAVFPEQKWTVDVPP